MAWADIVRGPWAGPWAQCSAGEEVGAARQIRAYSSDDTVSNHLVPAILKFLILWLSLDVTVVDKVHDQVVRSIDSEPSETHDIDMLHSLASLR